MLKHPWRTLLGAGLVSAVLIAPLRAHPHVWVTYEATLDYDNGSIAAIDHVWTFDDMYTAMAVEGLDKNHDGKYDRDELAELAKVNMDGLKDFDYFTYAKLGTGELKFSAPQDAWLEHDNGVLHLHFRLPLEKPVLAEAAGFTFSIYDPSFFIAFDPDKTNPVKLASGAPKGCKIGFLDPQTGANSEDLKAQLLNDAFAQQLGQTTNIGAGFTKTVTVSCAKS
jgi:ABC-type uncharacterized transport system substrate-binding protein